MEPAEGDVDELIEFWTVLDEDRDLLAGKRGATALGFVLLLKYYSRQGRFPRGLSDFAAEVVAYVARQVDVDGSTLGSTSGRGARSSTTVPKSEPISGSGSRRLAIRRS